jgi:hypothetical protein
MNSIKRIALAGTLALTFVSFGNVNTVLASDATEKQVEEKMPFETYGDCIDMCVDKYAAWTLRRSLCGADCYLELLVNAAAYLSPFHR